MAFHGFVELLMMLSHKYYLKQSEKHVDDPAADTSDSNALCTGFESLISFCVGRLRHHGVRSSRLRHRQVKVDTDSVNGENDDDDMPAMAVTEVYMLPSRLVIANDNKSGSGDLTECNSRERASLVANQRLGHQRAYKPVPVARPPHVRHARAPMAKSTEQLVLPKIST
jgi:hypothetical protein